MAKEIRNISPQSFNRLHFATGSFITNVKPATVMMTTINIFDTSLTEIRLFFDDLLPGAVVLTSFPALSSSLASSNGGVIGLVILDSVSLCSSPETPSRATRLDHYDVLPFSLLLSPLIQLHTLDRN